MKTTLLSVFLLPAFALADLGTFGTPEAHQDFLKSTGVSEAEEREPSEAKKGSAKADDNLVSISIFDAEDRGIGSTTALSLITAEIKKTDKSYEPEMKLIAFEHTKLAHLLIATATDSSYCGSLGCFTYVFIEIGGEWKPVFRENFGDLTIRKLGPQKVELTSIDGHDTENSRTFDLAAKADRKTAEPKAKDSATTAKKSDKKK